MGRGLTWLHRIWTSIVMILARTAVLAVILACLLLLIIQLPVVKSAVLKGFAEALDEQISGHVTFERLEGFLPFTITLEKAGLSGPGASLSADEIRVRFDLGDILRRTLTIDRIRLIGLKAESGWDVQEGRLAMAALFKPVNGGEDDQGKDEAPAKESPWWVPKFRLNTFVPDIGIQGGSIMAHGLESAEGLDGFPDTLRIDHLFGDLYLEIRPELQVFDIQELSGSIANLPIGMMEFSGQIYRVSDRTEFNGVSARTLGSVLDFSGEVGIGISDPLRDMFDPARWIEESFRFESESIRIKPSEWTFLGGAAARWQWPSPIELELDVKGDPDAIFVDRLRVFTGESLLDMEGRLPLEGVFPAGWDLSIGSLQVRASDMPSGSLAAEIASMVPGVRFSAKLTPLAGKGGRDSLDLRADLTQGRRLTTLRVQAGSPDGWQKIDGRLRMDVDSLTLSTDHLWPAPEARRGVDRRGVDRRGADQTDPSLLDQIVKRLDGVARLDGSIIASASGTRTSLLTAEATLNLQDLAIGELRLKGLSATSQLEDGVLDYAVSGGEGESTLDVKGRWDRTATPAMWTQRVELEKIGIGAWLPDSIRLDQFSMLVSSSLEAGFPDGGSGSFQGVFSDLLSDGEALEDVPFSVVVDRRKRGGAGSGPEGGSGSGAGSTSPASDRLVLESSVADVRFEGDFAFKTMLPLLRTTRERLSERIEEQVFMSQEQDVQRGGVAKRRASSSRPESLPGVMDGRLSLTLKDLSPLNAIITPWDVRSGLHLEGTLALSERRLLAEFEASDTLLALGNLDIEGLEGTLIADLNPLAPIREDSRLLVVLDADRIQREGPAWAGFHSTVSLEDESMAVTVASRRGGDAVHVVGNALLTLKPDTVSMDLYTFGAGLEAFEWSLETPARLDLSSDRRLRVEGLSMANGEQRIQMDGTFSRRVEDELMTGLVGVDLDQISDLLGGRLTFGGILDGRILSRIADGIPVVQGALSISGASLNDRPIGEFELVSMYVPEADHYELRASIVTDPEGPPASIAEVKAAQAAPPPSIASATPRPGQDISIEGFIRNPINIQPGEPRFDMTADIRRVDLGILQVLLPSLIVSSEGTGRGTVSLQDIDPASRRPLITGSLQVLRGTLEPVFMNTTYEVEGSVTYDNRIGFNFEPLRLYDRFGGSGRLTGLVAMTHLRAPIPMRLNLEMNRLLFMNNPYDPDIPFYSTIFGTGSLQLTGSDLAPVIRTAQPITVVPDSRVAVPLLDVINPETDSRFLTFVEEFDEDLAVTGSDEEAGGAGASDADEEEFVFLERFTFDLQFQAVQPMNFRMIFDPVTNDEISANGTGQIRITLQDEIFNMFGRMDILSGEYNFVSGDILARRFSLQEGGSILWDGDPIDARLDVSAVYRARPPISTLGVASLGSTSDTGVGQRVPIELVLQIFGNISQIQNEFSFQIPTGIAGINDPALNARISSLNRNQEEKLVQAFSILLTGNFIPSGQSTFENTSALQGFTGSAVLINPFVSSQLLSPLLSNQINSLLNENVTFDVDVNIDSYNEVELGVALRLYNDRLVLRREGQITGEQSTIGDIGATFRINSVFSMTAFHRQDPTFTSRSGQISSEGGNTQVINGVGLQARFQFHTWREFRERFSKSFATLFVRRKKKDQDQEQSETDPSPIAIRFLVPPDPERTGPAEEDDSEPGASDGKLPFTHRQWRQNRLDDVFTDY